MLYKWSSAGFACKYFFSFITNIFESFSSDLKNFNAGRKELLTIAVWNTGSMEISNLLHGRLCPPCKSCWRYDLSSFELFSLNIYCSFWRYRGWKLYSLLTYLTSRPHGLMLEVLKDDHVRLVLLFKIRKRDWDVNCAHVLES